MLDVVTWMWFDPHLEGPRQRRAIHAPEVRVDLLYQRRRSRRAGALPTPYTPPPVNPLAPRAFKPQHVNRLAQIFKKRLPLPHRFVCIADEKEGFSDDVHVIIAPPEAVEAGRQRSPEGNRFPSCYRRLWGFSKDAAKMLSERALVIDIDLIPVRDVAPIVNRPEPFVGWRPFRDWGRQMRIGGGLFLMTPGAHPEVWENFARNPRAAIAEARNAGFRGSDQAWLSYCLASKVPIYSRDSGLYSIRDLDERNSLPPDARIVQFNGPIKPWQYAGPAAWVHQHWNGA